ncbi:exo-rhamnogalacturonan lyase family protein [Viscerimonas tarda]
MKNVLKNLLASGIALLACQGAMSQSIDLQWVGDAPKTPVGVSWGLPFEKGKIKKGQQFVLTGSNNQEIPLQSWLMASHADGSAKWIGFSAAVTPEQASGLKVVAVKTANPTQGIVAEERSGEIVINNGIGEFVFSKTGANLIKSIKSGNTTVAGNGQLTCILENRTNEKNNVIQYDNFVGNIEKVTLEQSGPVRAVVKVEGKHKALKGSREWLPFVVRFYVYNNVEAVKMVHTIIFDGEQTTDFIKGLGVVFDLPLREEMYNRHVRFSGEGDGLWSEPIQPLSGRQRIQNPEGYTGQIYNDQVAGKRIPNKDKFNKQGQFLIDNWAIWNDFRLTQLSPDGFTVRKRTNDQSTWIGTAGDNRASGLILAGDASGGLAVSLKNFWQSYPVELEATNMRNDKAQLKVWLWSPQGDAMDLRHYDIIGHDLIAAYEDYQEGLSTPYGVGRTSELTLYPFGTLPTKEQTTEMAQLAQQNVQLMATPQYLHDAKAFGVWSLPDTSTDSKQWIEKQIDGYIDFYKQAIEDHRWYGFWNFGDVMHSYNAGRHTWNYDIGGNAWDNTELSPGIWLWLAFARTGRADIFTLAQNLTRHTSEVDMYHIGDLAGLGTRHNVSHWGCGSKEARIGQAWWKRYSYYLTTDERMGDLMHDVIDADYKMLKYDPLRIAQPRSEFPTNQPTRLRWGPDWIAFVGNWFAEWERTGDKKYLDKIKAGMSSLAAMPNGLFTGKGPLGYDPETGKLTYEGEPGWIDNRNHLANLMGGFEVMMEVYDAIGHKDFNNTFLMYAKYYGLPVNDPIRDLPENKKYKDWWGHWSTPRLGAFAAQRLNDPHLAEVAWADFFSSSVGFDGKLQNVGNGVEIETPDVLYPVNENTSVSTNSTAQWNINAIIMLELIGDKIPSLDKAVKDAAEKRAATMREQGQRQRR